jgi:ankyrin repeat protein
MTFDEAHRRIKRGDIVVLTHALDDGLDPNLANRFSWTLLMLAAMQGAVGIGECLVSRGAKINATNDFGDTALSLAAHAGHERFVRWLLANGAATDCHPKGCLLADWIERTSGLSPVKIDAMLTLLGLRPTTRTVH